MIALLAVALAQAAPVVTLDQALARAREANPDLKVAEARLAQAELAWRKVLANFLPKITAGGAYTYNENEAVLKMPSRYWIRDIGAPDSELSGPPYDPKKGPPSLDNPPGAPSPYILFPAEFVDITIQQRHQWGGQLQLDQALLVPALFPALQATRLAGKAAASSVESARREVLFAVAQVYFGAVGLKEAAAVQQRMLESALTHEHDAKVKLETGTMPKLFLVRAQIDRARAEQDVLRAKNAYRSALSALATLLNREPDFDVSRPADPQAPQADVAKLEQEALRHRPDLEAARLGEEVAGKGRTAAVMKYLPSIGLTARYQAANIKGFTGEYGAYSIMVGLNWTLWDGGLRETELKEAAAKIEEATAARSAAELRVRDELRRAGLELESALANRVKAAEQRTLARENMQLVEANFSHGVATPVEVSDARTALLGAEMAHLAEELSVQVAVLRLSKAAGLFNPQ